MEWTGKCELWNATATNIELVFLRKTTKCIFKTYGSRKGKRKWVPFDGFWVSN